MAELLLERPFLQLALSAFDDREPDVGWKIWRKKAGNMGMHPTIIPAVCSAKLQRHQHPTRYDNIFHSAYAINTTFDNTTVRFGLFAFWICHPRRAMLEPTALSESASLDGRNRQINAYSVPTANMMRHPYFCFLDMCNFHTEWIGMMSITRSEVTLMVDAVISKEKVSMQLFFDPSFFPTH